MSTATDAQYQDFGAIEAAVKETARGRAFLANYARRVRQSDALTALAMLVRLERLSDELASRLFELESGKVSLASQTATPGASLSQRWSAPAPTPEAMTTAVTDARDPLGDPATDVRSHAYLNGHKGETTQRIHELGRVLGSLHRHAVELASHRDEADVRGALAPSTETDAREFAAPDPPPLSSRPACDQDPTDEEVLDKIALALGPTP
ncbi:MAG TPA: hypothetical protein VIQ05_06210 [Tardiphaga sp.]